MPSLLASLSLEPMPRDRQVKTIRNPNLSPTQVVLRKAFTGELLGSCKRKLPHTLRRGDLARDTGVPLEGYRAALPGRSADLNGLVLDSTMCHDGVILLPLVAAPVVLRNARLNFMDSQCGLCKWYKEFRLFAMDARLATPELDGITVDGGRVSFFGADVRGLVPLILQFIAGDLRERFAENCPRWYRTRAGCEHGIVYRTGAPHNRAREFVTSWCLANGHILALLERAIRAEPHRNYFS